MIRFLLNKHEVALQDFAADTTVLDYLRDVQGKCGTKEGCASGDCGACTVVIASPQSDSLRYESVNSCITFLGALHGKQLLTVEDLADGDVLHPVQQSLVEYHASQCGFCTPGFVMSMFALYKNISPHTDRKQRHAAVSESLAGNLCRCTGYRPIVDAALACTKSPRPDKFSVDAQDVLGRLRKIATQNSLQQSDDKCGFMIPRTLSELAMMCVENPDARLLGGGTDLALEVTQQLKPQNQMIYLGEVTELQVIEHKQDSIEIGAAVSLSECDQALQEQYPQISVLLKRFGSAQVRNQGTIGGNIANASPIGDLPPVLIALDASLLLQVGDKERAVSIEEFFVDYRKTILQPGEFISRIIVPLPTREQQFRVYKVSKRLDDDISAVCMAINLTLDHNQNKKKHIDSARIVFGGMAATPKRASSCESMLQGAAFCDATLQQAAHALEQDFSPISDARASADYRIQIAKNLLKRFGFELNSKDVETRVEHVA